MPGTASSRLPALMSIMIAGLMLPAIASGQTTAPKFEYLMTYVAELDPPHQVDAKTFIVNLRGGWAKGPNFAARIVPPSTDWLRLLESGIARLDVRATFLTDDNQPVYFSYNGIIQHSKESAEKQQKGEVVTPADGVYAVAAPTFQTSAAKYAWMNGVQAVSKLVEIQISPEKSYVKFDVFVVR